MSTPQGLAPGDIQLGAVGAPGAPDLAADAFPNKDELMYFMKDGRQSHVSTREQSFVFARIARVA